MLTGGERGRRRTAGELGIVGINLAVVIAFALYAVIQLSRTTLAARQIRDRVRTITGEVVPINSDLNNVPKLDETNRIAADILTAAKPLSGQADQILSAAKSIDGTVSSILSTATDINGTVHSINGNVTTLIPTVNSIRDGVAAINGRADRVIAPVVGIKSDLDNVLGNVLSIRNHARSIDCPPSLVSGGSCGAG
jgi:methyl-accepting chemotaxis protein